LTDGHPPGSRSRTQGHRDAAPGEVLLSREVIRAEVARLGHEISGDYQGKVPILVAVLEGAIFFLADLAKELSVDCRFDFMAISRFNGRGEADGVVRITRDMGLNITGQHVILVEDIIDTGLTVAYLRKVLLTRRPASLETCVLLNRQNRRIADIHLKYSGLNLPNIFVVGYGLDYEGLYRNLPDIHRLMETKR
jgi:hypoxanthine phosphoribosyltransferase